MGKPLGGEGSEAKQKFVYLKSSLKFPRNQKVLRKVFRKSVEHAFCAALYASCLFFPLHLSRKQKWRIAVIKLSRFARGHG